MKASKYLQLQINTYSDQTSIENVVEGKGKETPVVTERHFTGTHYVLLNAAAKPLVHLLHLKLEHLMPHIPVQLSSPAGPQHSREITAKRTEMLLH